jgi:hypothetical protein
MSKLFAAIFAVMFAFGTTAVLAADKEAKKDAPKVDCKDPKNKDNKDCTAKKEETKKK